MNDGWDVIVVGAGPAGSVAATRLAECGVRVLLVDRCGFPRDKLCGEFLSPECWPMLDALRVGESIQNSGYQRIRRLRLTLPGGSSVEAALPHRAGRPAIGLSRAQLDHVLLLRARSAGVRVVENLQVVELIDQAGTVIGVRARPVLEPSGTRKVQSYYAKVIVAADGRQSGIVRISGRTTRVRRSTAEPICAVKRHYRFRDRAVPEDAIELFSFPGGYGGICRIESGVVNLCTLLPIPLLRRTRGRMDRAVREALNNDRLAEMLDDAEPLSDWKAIADVQVQRSRPLVPGVLYAGDAMGTVDPLGGEGMAMAIEGAFLAAGFIHRALHSRRGCDRSLQLEYEAAWIARFNQRIRLCRTFSWVLARPAVLRTILPPGLGDAWSQALLPLAFRATRGRVESSQALLTPIDTRKSSQQ